MLAVTSRPDILPTWIHAMSLTPADIRLGARYDHHYLALPAVTTGKCLLVAPEIVVNDLVQQGLLEVLSGSRTPSGMHYRAYAVDRSGNPDLARAFCRWLMRLCRRTLDGAAPPHDIVKYDGGRQHSRWVRLPFAATGHSARSAITD